MYFHRPRVRDKAAVAIMGRNSSPGNCRSSGTKFKMSSAMPINVFVVLKISLYHLTNVVG